MTREEANKCLKWFKEYNEEDYCGGDRIQDEHGDWYYRITEQDFEAFEMAIKALEQEPKTGHWINKQCLFNSCSAECSSCHKRLNGYMHDNGFSLECKYYDFCPNCGADMRGEE